MLQDHLLFAQLAHERVRERVHEALLDEQLRQARLVPRQKEPSGRRVAPCCPSCCVAEQPDRLHRSGPSRGPLTWASARGA